jgi:hypothetical protein
VKSAKRGHLIFQLLLPVGQLASRPTRGSHRVGTACVCIPLSDNAAACQSLRFHQSDKEAYRSLSAILLRDEDGRHDVKHVRRRPNIFHLLDELRRQLEVSVSQHVEAARMQGIEA